MKLYLSYVFILLVISGCAAQLDTRDNLQKPTDYSDKTNFPDFSPGKWSIALDGYFGKEVFRDCMSPSSLISETLAESECNISSMRKSGKEQVYFAHCNKLEGESDKTGDIEITISGDENNLHITTILASNRNRLYTEVNAKRIGECEKLRWPVSQCVEQEPLQCSTPVHVPYFNDKFAPACVQHDYCYRHGWASYGFSKKDCDDRFRQQLMSRCGGIIVGMGWSCRNAASLYYNAVKESDDAAASYKQADSTCCLFRSDVEPCSKCQDGGKSCPIASQHQPPPPVGKCCEMDYETGKCSLYVKPPQVCP